MITLPPEDRVVIEAHFVKVINHNNFLITDMYDGVPFKFPTNVAVNIPSPAATHIFGYPGEKDTMRAHTCKRLGWNTPRHLAEELDRKYFDKLEIRRIVVRQVEVDPDDPNAPIAADREQPPGPELSTSVATKGRTGTAR